MKGILILFFSDLVGGHLVACIKRNFIKTLFFTVSKINLKNYQFYKNDLHKDDMFQIAQRWKQYLCLINQRQIVSDDNFSKPVSDLVWHSGVPFGSSSHS